MRFHVLSIRDQALGDIRRDALRVDEPRVERTPWDEDGGDAQRQHSNLDSEAVETAPHDADPLPQEGEHDRP